MDLRTMIRGHENFRKSFFAENEKEFVRLVEEGQAPSTLLITCSDARVVPHLIIDADPGDLFVVRNVGNFVPPYSASKEGSSIGAALDFALHVLKVNHIVICGHTHCGAIEAILKKDPLLAKNKALNAWLSWGEEACEGVHSIYPNASDEPRAQRCAEKFSILHQINNLYHYPNIGEMVEKKEIFLHAWYYRIEEGIIEYYDAEQQSFQPLDKHPET